MEVWILLLAVATAVLVLYAAFVIVLVLRGRHEHARALAGFVPDCVILFKRLLGDPTVPRRHKVLLVLLVAYLSMPLDLVPDFIPVAGQLDDAIIVAWALRTLLRGSGPALVRLYWPGPQSSLDVMLRLAGEKPATIV